MQRIPGRRLFFLQPTHQQQNESNANRSFWQWMRYLSNRNTTDAHSTSSSPNSDESSSSSQPPQPQQGRVKRHRYFIIFIVAILFFSSFLFVDEETTLSFFIERNTLPLLSSSHSLLLNSTIPIEDYQRLSDRFWTDNINVESDSNCEFIPQTSVPVEKITFFEPCPQPSLPPSASLSDLQFHQGTLSFSFSSSLYGLNLKLSTVDEQHDHTHVFRSDHELQHLIYHSSLSSKPHRYHPRKKDKNWAHMHKIHSPFSWHIDSEFVEFFLEPYDYAWGEGKVRTEFELPKSTIPLVLQSVIPRTTKSASPSPSLPSPSPSLPSPSPSSSSLPNILILSVDSVSRANFMRSLPKTADVLKGLNLQRPLELEKNNHTSSPASSSSQRRQIYRSFVFNRFNAQQGTSAANLTPVLAGKSYDIEKLTERVWTTRTYVNPEVSKKDWIWNWLKTKGYVTMFGSDVLNEFLGAHLWDWTGFDHMAPVVEGDDNWIYNSTLHLVKEEEGGGRGNSFRRSRCVGGKFVHEYLVDYARSFWKTYEEVEPSTPRFAYLHFNEAHIKDQFAVNVIDDSTAQFLEEILRPSLSSSSVINSEKEGQGEEKTGKKETATTATEGSNRPTIVIVLSDHGREGGVEQQLPLLSFVLPIEVLASNSRLEQNLFDNQQRLISGYDVYKTLKHLVSYLEKEGEEEEENRRGRTRTRRSTGVRGTPQEETQRLIETQPTTPPPPSSSSHTKDTSQSLLLPLSTSRTCEEAGLSSLACVCTIWKPMAPSLSEFSKKQLGVLGKLMELVVKEANEKTEEARKVCQLLEVRLDDESIHSFEVTKPLSALEFYKVVFSFRGSQVKHVVVASRFLEEEEEGEGEGRKEEVRFRGIEWLHQLTNHRVYQQCTPDGIDPEFCLCDLSSNSKP